MRADGRVMIQAAKFKTRFDFGPGSTGATRVWPKRGSADAVDHLTVLSDITFVRPASDNRVRDETAENKPSPCLSQPQKHGPRNKERRALADEPRGK